MSDTNTKGKILCGSPNAEKFASGSTQRHVRTSKVMNRCFGQHGVVLQLGLPQRRTVSGDQHKFGYIPRLISSRDLLSLTLQSPWKEAGKGCCTFAVSHLLQGRLVSEKVLSRLDDQSETGRDGLGGFGGFGFLGGGHGGRFFGGGLFANRGVLRSSGWWITIGPFVDPDKPLYSLIGSSRLLTVLEWRRGPEALLFESTQIRNRLDFRASVDGLSSTPL